MLSVALRSTAAPHLVRLARPRAARGSSGKPARAYTCDVRRRDALRKSPLPTLPLRDSAGPARLLSEGQPFQRTRAQRGGGGFAPQPLPAAGAACGLGSVLRTSLGAPRGWLPPSCSRGLQGLRLDAWPRFAVPQTPGERHAKLGTTHRLHVKLHVQSTRAQGERLTWARRNCRDVLPKLTGQPRRAKKVVARSGIASRRALREPP